MVLICYNRNIYIKYQRRHAQLYGYIMSNLLQRYYLREKGLRWLNRENHNHHDYGFL